MKRKPREVGFEAMIKSDVLASAFESGDRLRTVAKGQKTDWTIENHRPEAVLVPRRLRQDY